MREPVTTPQATQHKASQGKANRSRGRWLLLLPYLGLCFPELYARATPALWGFPFFYWYQFAWVILASALIWIVYRRHVD